MNGIINVLKPTGMSSHDVVSFIRRKMGIKKVGHTGTLDPNAAGVLPICIGKGTKIAQYLVEKKKRYRCELTLGYETDSQDRYGQVLNQCDIKIESNELVKIIKSFVGDSDQTPPMFSAVKHKGKRLYELAREGKTIERKSRRITIYNIDHIQVLAKNRVMFDVLCSKGTYIRTLCHDIGKEAGTYGYMSFLLRTEVDIFKLEDSYTLEEIESYCKKGDSRRLILPLDYPLTHMKKIKVKEDYEKIVLNGGKLILDNVTQYKDFDTDEKLRVYLENRFIGIGYIQEIDNTYYLRMDKVLV